MSEYARKLVDDETLQQIRELACRQTGMTMAELLEAEASVCHPKEIIPVEPTPAQLSEANMKRAGVPDRHIENVGRRPPQDCYALNCVRAWSQTRDAFLVLQGGPGTRKTGSACWALGQSSGLFLESSGLITAFLAKDEHGKRARWDAVLRAGLVVLDDLGTERRDAQGLWLEAFSELWNGTYNGSKRLIVTTNTVTRELFKLEPHEGGYGARAFSRLTESGRWSGVGNQDVRATLRDPGCDDD
jgi:hypothetical protein